MPRKCRRAVLTGPVRDPALLSHGLRVSSPELEGRPRLMHRAQPALVANHGLSITKIEFLVCISKLASVR